LYGHLYGLADREAGFFQPAAGYVKPGIRFVFIALGVKFAGFDNGLFHICKF
jgi:hypothetical protein